MMVAEDLRSLVKRPAQNKKCPCGSKLTYKKCGCSMNDKKRTDDFIAGKTAEMEKKEVQKNVE